MVFGDGLPDDGCCRECGCPKTLNAFLREAKPIAETRESWKAQKEGRAV